MANEQNRCFNSSFIEIFQICINSPVATKGWENTDKAGHPTAIPTVISHYRQKAYRHPKTEK